jgi:hypothetical protein
VLAVDIQAQEVWSSVCVRAHPRARGGEDDDEEEGSAHVPVRWWHGRRETAGAF